MLEPLRKFSTTIYAKALLLVIIIPFVFWGMGSSLSGGNKNIVVTIDKEKYTIQEFAKFIDSNRSSNQKIKPSDIENLLSKFIGEKLIEKEVEYFNIKLSDDSLSRILKNQEDFKRDNKFSRTEYEKFLLKNNTLPVTFEKSLSRLVKKEQFLNMISGGVSPPKFLINSFFDNINQKRTIEILDLNEVFKNKLNFSDDEIRSHYKNSSDKYKEIYKSIKFIKLEPKNLVEGNEFNDLFFKKIDEIDNLIIEGSDLNEIVKKFNLKEPNLIQLNLQGQDINSNPIENLTNNVKKKIFSMSESEPLVLIESANKYFIAEYIKNENIQRTINNSKIFDRVKLDLKTKTKRKLISELINKINENNYSKSEFDKLSNNANLSSREIVLKNLNDNKLLKKEIVEQIYKYPKERVILVNDLSFNENYLVYIKKIDNVKVTDNSEDFQNYKNLSKVQIISSLYNTYDNFIKNRYKIDINYQTLNTVKNTLN